MEQKVVIITGASSGMGKAAAKYFADQGWLVFAGARHPERIPQVKNVIANYLDITSDQAVAAFVAAVREKSARIDALINAAGYGEYGPAEEVTLPVIKNVMQTNFYGAVRMTKAVLPVMRQQGFGRIVNVSSGTGNAYLPTGAYYSASKAALQIWSDTLNAEITPFGLRATVVMPGSTNTNFIDKMFASFQRNHRANSVYQPLIDGIIKMSKGYPVNATAEDLAKLFYRAATDRHPRLRYFNRFQDRMSVYLARNHPVLWRWIVNRSTRQMMGIKEGQ